MLKLSKYFLLDTNIASLINDSDLRTVTDHFVNILSLERNSFFAIVEIWESKFVPKIKNIHTPIAIFIDNVDEYFNKHIINQEQAHPSTIGMTSSLVWYYSQIGLVDAIYKLFRVNHHIKIFASIRKEAFLKLAEYDSMIQQYLGVSIDIAYTYSVLKEIFLKNISREHPRNFVVPSNKDTDPIYSFLGIFEVTHEYTYEKEMIFDYIYRHTLLRPRDFMTIGGRISQLSPHERNEDNLKRVINKAATEIANQYINEFNPHMYDMKLKKILSLIKSNNLSEKEVKNICSKFNAISCIDRDCKGCPETHIFCDLFKLGLLGYVRKEPVSGQEIQTFIIPGAMTFAQSGVLPSSSHYLIHPVLDEKIRTANTEYENNIDKVNIIGYDRVWKNIGKIPPESLRRPSVFISSTMDMQRYRDAIENVVKSKNFAAIRSETINTPDSLRKFKSLATECELFVSILGARYGEEFESKSICEHEFDAAFTQDPQKIFVYISEGNMEQWEDKQKKFAERVQGLVGLSYARGERVNHANIANRFEKDIVERITYYLKSKIMHRDSLIGTSKK